MTLTRVPHQGVCLFAGPVVHTAAECRGYNERGCLGCRRGRLAPDLSKIPPACGRIFFNSARGGACWCTRGRVRSPRPWRCRAFGEVGMTGLGRPVRINCGAAASNLWRNLERVSMAFGVISRDVVEILNAALFELGGLIRFPGESGCLNLVVVTRNTKDFIDSPARFLNPWAPE